jgi:hypoxanthine-guanine phosphoribosyltransferase
LLVDAAASSGRTLAFARWHLLAAGASPLWTAVLVDAPSRRAVDLRVDRSAFQGPGCRLVGYGLGDDGRGRFLPDIAVPGESGEGRNLAPAP